MVAHSFSPCFPALWAACSRSARRAPIESVQGAATGGALDTAGGFTVGLCLNGPAQSVAGDFSVRFEKDEDGIGNGGAPHGCCSYFQRLGLTGQQALGFFIHQMRPSVGVSSGADRQRGVRQHRPLPPLYHHLTNQAKRAVAA